MIFNKNTYPETRQVIAEKILENYGNEISKEFKKILCNIQNMGYFELDNFVNKKGLTIKFKKLFEKIFLKEKIKSIRNEYLKYSRLIIKENKENIKEEYIKKIYGNSDNIVQNKIIINFVDKLRKRNFYFHKDTRKSLENFNERIRFEIAKIIAKENGEKISKTIKEYNFSNKQFLLEIAKISVKENSYKTIEFIEIYGLENEEDRFEIAKIAAMDNSSQISKNIKLLNLNEKLRFEIAKITANQNGWEISEHISNYGLENEEDRFEIAKIAANQDGKNTSKYLKNYQIENEEDRLEIAKIAANQNGWKTSEYISNYGLENEEDRFEIAKIAANQNGWKTSEYISNYGLENEEDRFEIAKIAANQNGWKTSEYISNYGLENEEDRFEIAKIAANQDGKNTSKYLKNYQIENEQNRIEIAKIILKNKLFLLGDVIKDFEIGNTNIENYYVRSSYELILKIKNDNEKFINLGLLSEEKLNILFYYGKESRFENLKYLFVELLFTKDEEIKSLDKNYSYEDKQKYFYLSKLGFKDSFIKSFIFNKKISKNTYENFCTSCIKIEKNLGKDFFKFFSFDEKLLNDKKLKKITSFLNILINIIEIIGENKGDNIIFCKSIIFTINELIKNNDTLNETKSKVCKVLEGFISSKESIDNLLDINLGNIDFIINNLELIFSSFFEIVFKINGNNDISKKIINLEKIWGDIDVIKTLISRFSGNKKWHKEIPILTFIIEIVLNGGEESFKNFKYFGNGGSNEDIEQSKIQLLGLNNQQVKKWLNNNYSLKYINTKSDLELNKTDLLKIGKNEFLEQLIGQGHINKVKEGLKNELNKLIEKSEIKKDELITLRNCIKNNHGIKKIESIFYKNFNNSNLLIYLLYLACNTEEYEEFKSIINLLKGGLTGFKLNNIKNDLDSINSKLNPIEKGSESILFTTIFDNPKMLLEVGSLVKTFSCQDYKNGDYIESLIGYVIDANIKGVASFSITKDLAINNNIDFEKLKNKIELGNYKLSFNPYKGILKIDEFEIFLGSAIGRRIIKLGTRENLPKLIAELNYNSTNFVMNQSLDEMLELIQKFANDMGIELVNGNIELAGSKNPLGVYSDLAGGIMVGKYYIN